MNPKTACLKKREDEKSEEAGNGKYAAITGLTMAAGGQSSSHLTSPGGMINSTSGKLYSIFFSWMRLIEHFLITIFFTVITSSIPTTGSLDQHGPPCY